MISPVTRFLPATKLSAFTNHHPPASNSVPHPQS